MNNNKSLYWYGFFANFKKGIGKTLIYVGLFFGLFSSIINIYLGMFIFLIFLGIGIYLIATGSSQRFDYQRQSGTIVHGGDNFK